MAQTPLPCSVRFLPKHDRHHFALRVAHFAARTHTRTNTHTHGPLRRALLKGIQSHGEIWPYRLNGIVVILCLTCFGDVCVGLRHIVPCWTLESVQKVQICRSSGVAGLTALRLSRTVCRPLNTSSYLLTTSPFLNLL